MSPLDLQLIQRKITMILKDIDRLKEYELLSFNQFEEEINSQLIVERLLERIIGRMFDVNFHILKESFHYTPHDYRDSFTELTKRNVIDKELGNNLAKSAGLRNVLAHEYDDIDKKKVHESIKKVIKYLPQYLKIISTYGQP